MIAVESVKSAYWKLDPNKKSPSYELFGLDFMIDEEFNVFLIEANTNPCLDISSPLLSRLIPALIENVARVAIDPIMPPPLG